MVLINKENAVRHRNYNEQRRQKGREQRQFIAKYPEHPKGANYPYPNHRKSNKCGAAAAHHKEHYE